MAKVDVKCPFFEQKDAVKKYGYGKGGRPQSCKSAFQLEYACRARQPGMKAQIVDLTMNNAGIRGTAQVLHISINAIVRMLKNSHCGM